MPFSKDPQNGGSNKDGSKSELYCSLCYQKGKFTGDFKTAQEMQAFCVEKMKEQGVPGFLAWLMTRGIPRLERWKQN